MKIINVYARTRQGANILGRKIHKWNKDRTGLTRPDPKRSPKAIPVPVTGERATRLTFLYAGREDPWSLYDGFDEKLSQTAFNNA